MEANLEHRTDFRTTPAQIRAAGGHDARDTPAADPVRDPLGSQGRVEHEVLADLGWGLGLPAGADVTTLFGPSALTAERVLWSHRNLRSLPSSGFVETQDGLTVGWKDYGRFSVTVEPRPAVVAEFAGIDESQAVLGVALSVLPMALPFFGLEPLHGAAVGLAAGGLLILGDRGAGKSTLAGELVRCGATFLADDVCAIDCAGRLHPGPGLATVDRPRRGEEALDGYDGKAVVRRRSGAAPATPVLAVIVLERRAAADAGPAPLDRRQALERLLGHVRTPWVLTERRRATQLSAVARVAGRPVAALGTDHGARPPEALAEAVLRWSASLTA
jgi:hypothetical protein